MQNVDYMIAGGKEIINFWNALEKCDLLSTKLCEQMNQEDEYMKQE